jgi:hypothetical protein
MTKEVEGNETVAIWSEKNGPVRQQCIRVYTAVRGVPPRSYFAHQYFLVPGAHGTCMDGRVRGYRQGKIFLQNRREFWT